MDTFPAQSSGRLVTAAAPRVISNSTKLRLVKALVWPVMSYGCEAWKLNKAKEKEYKLLKTSVCGVMVPWTRKLTTTAVYQLAGTTPVLLHHVKARKMEYFDRSLCQLKDSIEHEAKIRLTQGSRIRGRPMTSWIDNVFQLECGPMPNVMVALPNGALYSMPQTLADAHY